MTAKATIEYGLFGFRLQLLNFEAENIDGLIKKINKKTEELRQQLIKAEEKTGDLRSFCPPFANGYPSFGGVEPEFGNGNDEFDGAILELKLDDIELQHNMKGYRRLKAATFMS